MISMDKEYRYRNGETARILCVDAPGPAPVRSMDGNGSVFSHRSDGANTNLFYCNEEVDLIEVKPRIQREYWANLYHDSEVLHDSRKGADEGATSNRLACVPICIDCEEGEGL